ncbi:MAG: phosphoribosylglycinamide formyltransferase [Oscillospiraceae bacterium]|jgi:phosphoribosylglycinamide formyltransferase-1|nr:phosphoribosylglycinamide formyltransferase [Oscillospiraceae bacterium]
MLDVVVMVSGGGTNLQALIDAKSRGELPHVNLRAVVSSSPNAYALTRAADAGIEAVSLDIKLYSDRAVYTRELRTLIRAYHPGLIVTAGFLYVLTPDFAEEFEGRIINIHPSLLPSFGGVGCYGIHVHEKALAAGVKVTGATVHFVTAIPDTGPIIAQKAVEVADGDTPESLQRRVMEQAEWIILPKAVEEFCANT